MVCFVFFFNVTATTEIYTLSLHDALPISAVGPPPPADLATGRRRGSGAHGAARPRLGPGDRRDEHRRRLRQRGRRRPRSEEHTSELQSRQYLVCRLLLEKKKTDIPHQTQL